MVEYVSQADGLPTRTYEYLLSKLLTNHMGFFDIIEFLDSFDCFHSGHGIIIYKYL
jgi:hypothetical protein